MRYPVKDNVIKVSSFVYCRGKYFICLLYTSDAADEL